MHPLLLVLATRSPAEHSSCHGRVRASVAEVRFGSGQIFPNLEPDFGSGSEVFPNLKPERERTGPKVLWLQVVREEIKLSGHAARQGSSMRGGGPLNEVAVVCAA